MLPDNSLIEIPSPKRKLETRFDNVALRREFSANVVGFCRWLRRQGSSVSTPEQIDALRALDAIDLLEEENFYWSLRTTLAKSTREQEIFDEHFRHFWYVRDKVDQLSSRDQEEAEDPSVIIDDHLRKQKSLTINDWLNNVDQASEEQEAAGYSPFEVVTERDFSDFLAQDLDEVDRLINEIGKSLALRFSRRTKTSRQRGPLDLRRTMRSSLRRGGELLDLAHRERKRQKLKLVLLCDVSKSMDLYSRFLIQFLYAFQSVYRRIETFVFSTSLHRVTEFLQTGELEEALNLMAESVPDWSGGTKIGESFGEFVEHYALSLLDQGTVVLIISDGWDTGDVELLGESMRIMKLRSRSVIWLNPLMGNPDYRPSTQGMQAALPYIDILASAHNLSSLRRLVRQLSKVQRGRQLRIDENTRYGT
ncbi:MAG TPA: VWA containing CoxE family protein [Deltaproteobacteria bacterium]|nr:VWA containing CoxE family protein [Deltaproteobacteria bacterium]|tara:strand:- start:2527 stop:3789 length:1263 start_codon:yes stop_codon:yes gene_type:complete